jgi:hypothetical protein
MLQAGFMAANKRVLLVLLCALLVPVVPFVVIGELPGERWLMRSGAALAIAAGAERMPLPAYLSSVVVGDLMYAAALAADGAALLPEGTWGAGMLLPVVAYLTWRKLSARRVSGPA